MLYSPPKLVLDILHTGRWGISYIGNKPWEGLALSARNNEFPRPYKPLKIHECLNAAKRAIYEHL